MLKTPVVGWYSIRRDIENENVKIYRSLFRISKQHVLFHLEVTTDHYLANYSESNPSISQEIIRKIRSSIYPDNLSTKANSLENAKTL